MSTPIPGDTRGTAQVATSPVTLADFAPMKASALSGDEDRRDVKDGDL